MTHSNNENLELSIDELDAAKVDILSEAELDEVSGGSGIGAGKINPSLEK